jgi:hypothetical protein
MKSAYLLSSFFLLLVSSKVGFGAPAAKIMESSSGNVTVAQTPEKKASDSAITRIAFLEIGVSVHFLSCFLKPIDGKLIADGI